jgi:hypothetical protein
MDKNNTTKLLTRIGIYMTYTLLAAYFTNGYPWYTQLSGLVIAIVCASGLIWTLEE